MASSKTTIPVNITPTEASNLMALTMHPGYEVLIKIMSTGANMDVLDVLNTDSMDEKEIIGLQRLAKASKRFYDRVCNTVDWIVSEIRAEKEQPSAVEEEANEILTS
jgi:hypothetical protein